MSTYVLGLWIVYEQVERFILYNKKYWTTEDSNNKNVFAISIGAA